MWFSGIHGATRQDLEKWANDPNCIEMDICAKKLAEREGRLYQPARTAEEQRLAGKEDGEDDPFNPRTEVSADARYIATRIVTHLWIIFVLFPVVAVLLLLAAGVLR